MKKNYIKGEQWIKQLILNWYDRNGKEYNVNLSNEFKK